MKRLGRKLFVDVGGLGDLRPLLDFGADEGRIFFGLAAAGFVALAQIQLLALARGQLFGQTSCRRVMTAFGVAAGTSTPFQL